MWFETHRRIIDILKTLESSPVTNTYCVVADNIPADRADHHWYMIIVKPTRDAVQTPLTSDTRTHLLNFAIECYSQQVLTGQAIAQEYLIMAYADAITAKLEQYPRLESVPSVGVPGRIGLTGVQSIFVSGSQFQTPRPYPDGNTVQYYSVTVNLQVQFKRVTGC